MTVSYEIILTIVNLTNDNTENFLKTFEFKLDGLSDDKLYNNHHLIAEKVQMFTLFKNEINSYCRNHSITINNIDIDEFNINSNTDRVDVYFESDDDHDSNISLEPNIKCYVYPKYEEIIAPVLSGEAYDNHTIIWSWEDDGQAHYIVEEPIDVTDESNQERIIAQIPIGTNTYTESGLDSDTSYTRRIISYNENQTSLPSRAVTVQTATAPIDISLEEYSIPKNYDYTADDSERDIINENLEAFHSGVGDYNDLKVYKQMDADFYQQFNAYIQLRGSRTVREKRYDSVGFNYKVCLEATETIEEQKGEVTFDIDVYPIENLSIKDYMYAVQPVTICARMWCDVLLTKQDASSTTVTCGLMQPKWELTQIKVDHHKVAEVVPFNGTLTLILSIDISKSMRDDDRIGTVKNAAIAIIKKAEESYTKNDTKLTGKIKYCIYLWSDSESDARGAAGLSAQQAIDSIEDIHDGDLKGGTNHYLGLTGWMNLSGITEAKVLCFFTDGFSLTCDEVEYCFMDYDNYEEFADGSDTSHEASVAIADSVTKAYNELKNANVSTFCLFGANPDNEYDQDYKEYWNENQTTQQAIRIHNQRIRDRHKKGADDFAQINNTGGYNYYNLFDTIDTHLQETIAKMPVGTAYHWEDDEGNDWGNVKFHMEDGGWAFKGWESVPQQLTMNASWDIDKYKWTHVVIPPMSEQPWQYTINDTITPVVYARNEQRAIVPSDSIIVDRNFDQEAIIRQEAIKLDNRSIQEMIVDAVQYTDEWVNQGYNRIAEAYTDEELAQGRYIIRGLFIKDTYKYADEDTVPDVNFTDDGLTDGYTGTLNVYADINKFETNTFGDDVYAVGTNKFVWLSGYTDAIIYDGDRIASFELNASHKESTDHQTEIIVSPVENYKNLLWNRKNKTIRYTGRNEDIYHCIDVIVKDKDIYITGTNSLQNVEDWTLFLPRGKSFSDLNSIIRGVQNPIIENLNGDITAHNDEHYQSPILNYRFNYEDPDAYTCYYELLPDCDPFSPYKNIVLVHIYYARNIYIQNEENIGGTSTHYIERFGEDNIATRSSLYYSRPNLVKGQTYFRDDYIDDYIWFQAKPMIETRPYYDEKPNPGMDSFYGNVNGRYRESNKSGKQDLRVVTPQFNLPTTINANEIKIYIIITEFYPSSALVAYKWDHPSNIKDSITTVNGDYVTFMSDSLTYKDVVYNELIQTITTSPIELFDNKTTLKFFEVTKPLTRHQYERYYIELFSNNSDVIALNYPSEIVFDEESNKAEFGANFKGVVNATTKWSPRIHNGYYYLNQHEYYAYSEFKVEADFEEYNEENYKTINGYLAIDVELLRLAGPSEHYDIIKSTRSELLQNEKEFIWIDNKGLTITPIIDGEYYKEYTARIYTSPIIIFPHILTSAGQINVDYHFEDSSDDLQMHVRSYDLENGVWSEWTNFSNDSIPNVPLSCAYQVQFTLAASVVNHDKVLEDYLCCYLDWVDDGSVEDHTNCVTITDHLQAGPYESDGIFVSKIIDFGCETTMTFDMFASNINKDCSLYIAIENYNSDKLDIGNVKWTLVKGSSTVTARFFRYKIVIPYGEKVYWLHKKITTKESDVQLPYIKSIRMIGDFTPQNTMDSFQEIQSFSITTDATPHRIFASIYDIISGDIHNKGFQDSEIHYVKLNCMSSNISINYNNNVDGEYPLAYLNTPIYATADFDTELSVKYTPYIFADKDPVKELDVIHITKGTPQQYSPITVEDINDISYVEVFDVDPSNMKKTEIFNIQNEDDIHYIKLARNDFDIKTLQVFLNGELFDKFNIVNNLIIFQTNPEIDDEVRVLYNILNSFYTNIDYENDRTDITIYSDYDSEEAKKQELVNLEPIIETYVYTECYLSQIYANGAKLVFNKNSISNDSYWKYTATVPGIYYSTNNNYFSMIVNDLVSFKEYEMQIVAYSENNDNDIIGFVVAYKKDPSNTIHTLSYLISLGTEDNEYDMLFNNCNVALVYDYCKTTQHTISSKYISHVGYKYWNELPNGIKFSIKKTTSGMVECKITNWNNIESWNSESIITFNLNTIEETKLFTDPVSYGFCVHSQQDTYFKEPQFRGRADRSIGIEEQATNLRHKYKVYFETNKVNNKFIAEDLSLNPVYRTDYKGFIYLTDEHNEPYKINIYRNPKYIKAGGYDKIDVVVECLDYQDNPVISKDIDIDCQHGILNFDNNDAKHLTDINGVIHLVYESAVDSCTDILVARTVTSDGVVIQSSVDIVNE